jgi:quercetin dioxygenase-like cupin family protein
MIKKTSPVHAKKVDAPVDGRIMYSDSRVEAIFLTLAPGENMPIHTNPFDVLFICIQGTAILLADQQKTSISQGETIYVSSDELRGWKNPGTNPCRIMVLKIFFE